MKPYDFKWSTFYENDSTNLFKNHPFELHNDELIICSIIIDADNFSVLTTKKLVTLQNGILSSGSLINSTDQFYGNFKSETQRFP